MNPIETMTIEWACEKLCRQYNVYSDLGDFGALSALFAEDALFIRPTMPDVEFKTRAEILAAFNKRPPITVQHQINNCVVDVQSPTEAMGICVLSFLMAPGIDQPLPRIGGPIHFGEFRDRFLLTAEGWRFAERRGRMILKSA
ncbi:MAG TPA: nuclear transport factor 2 family protein [Pseudomonadales bacterium]